MSDNLIDSFCLYQIIFSPFGDLGHNIIHLFCWYQVVISLWWFEQQYDFFCITGLLSNRLVIWTTWYIYFVNTNCYLNSTYNCVLALAPWGLIIMQIKQWGRLSFHTKKALQVMQVCYDNWSPLPYKNRMNRKLYDKWSYLSTLGLKSMLVRGHHGGMKSEPDSGFNNNVSWLHFVEHKVIWIDIITSNRLIQCWHPTCRGNPVVEIRRSYDRLISTMGFPLLVRW